MTAMNSQSGKQQTFIDHVINNELNCISIRTCGLQSDYRDISIIKTSACYISVSLNMTICSME